MPKGARPNEMTEWIGGGRSFKSVKAIRSIPVFEARFLDWWKNVQPSERAKDQDGWPLAESNVATNWDQVRFTGRNGLVSVLVALFFWGVALGSDEARRGSVGWQKALRDVKFVLGHLVRSAPDSTVNIVNATPAVAQKKGESTPSAGGTSNGVIVEKENLPQKRKRTVTEKAIALDQEAREKEAKRMASQKRYGVFDMRSRSKLTSCISRARVTPRAAQS